MASNLRVDTILPSTGTTLGIGTASGTINFLGNSNITTTGTINAASAIITGNLGVGGVLTYEDVTNIDSVGVITARSGGYLDIRTGSSINTNATGSAASGTIHKNTNSGEFAIVSGGTGGNNHLTFYTSASAAPTEKLRITSDGQVLIGATSYAGGGNNPAFYIRTASANAVKIHKTGSGQSSLQLTCDSGTDPDEGNSTGLQLTQEGTSSYIMNQDNGDMFVLMDGTNTIQHRANGTIRARSAVSGTNTATYNENVAWNSFSCNSSNGYDFKIINQNSSPAYSYSLELAAAANVNNTNYRHINCTKNSNSAGIFVVYGNGNVANANNSYGSTSDVKLKENIVDANSQWDDVKQLRVRNFNFIADSNKTKLLGLVAQEAETVCPSLVQNIKDLEEDENGNKTETGTVTKELKYSVLYMKAIKALQEAQTRIETLESKVAALEGS